MKNDALAFVLIAVAAIVITVAGVNMIYQLLQFLPSVVCR